MNVPEWENPEETPGCFPRNFVNFAALFWAVGEVPAPAPERLQNGF